MSALGVLFVFTFSLIVCANGFSMGPTDHPSHVTAGSPGSDLKIPYTGDPTYPITGHLEYYGSDCADCEDEEYTWTSSENPLVWPGAIYCKSGTTDGSYFTYSLYLVDVYGEKTPRTTIWFTCDSNTSYQFFGPKMYIIMLCIILPIFFIAFVIILARRCRRRQARNRFIYAAPNPAIQPIQPQPQEQTEKDRIVTDYVKSLNYGATDPQLDDAKGTEPEPENGDEWGALCKVCYVHKVDCVLLNCGHQGLCQGCATKLDQCPWCRLPVERVMKVYRV
mmetsp:Transcript_23749/g.26351  ORF Transcript_23749/g.26351 Transcript_23749/m.26351 type:complete len:278 (+) Transcript_23749:57-890(+)